MHPRIEEIRLLASIFRAELERFVEETNAPWELQPHDLSGACGISSWAFSRCLRFIGIRSTIEHSGDFGDEGGHAWLSIDGTDGDIVIDMTATQFGDKDKIKIIERRHDERYKATSSGFGVTRDFESWWGQSPYPHRSRLSVMCSNVLQKFKAISMARQRSAAA